LIDKRIGSGWMSHRAFVRAAGLLVLLALGCAGLPGCSKDAHAGLDGTGWTLVGWSVSSLYPGDFEITAAFSDGRITGKAAVNTYGGAYAAGTLKDGAGRFSTGRLVRTLMAGPDPAMRAEDLFFQLLAQARFYSLTGGKLTLSDVNDNQLLIFDRAG
jgi:heat shock protein HslJ